MQIPEEGYKPVVRLFRNQADTLVHLTYTTGSAPRNVETGAASASARWTFDHTDGSRIATGTRTATITGTQEHPFCSLTRHDWIGMGEVEAGERLQLAGGQTATATAIRIEHLATPVTVFNFEVADWHTYHVGTAETGWVFVHNQCALGRAYQNLGVNKLKGMRAEARTKGTELHKLVSGQRRTAVREAWKAEKALLKANKQGTVDWTGPQRLQLKVFGRVRGFQGHHINSVAGSPYMASWKSNVTFMNRADHLAAHGGNRRTRTYGNLREIYGGGLR